MAFCVLSGALLQLAFAVTSVSGFADSSQSAQKVVEEFCNWEFNASPDMDKREELVSFSEGEAKRRRSQRPKYLSLHFVEWQSDPRIIVSAYKIESVNAEGNRGVAVVRYHVIGKTDRQEVFVVLNPHDETVTLTLEMVSGKWKVLDPPVIHVSKEATLLAIQHDLARTAKLMKDPKAVPYQAPLFERRKKAVETIEAMRP